VPQPPQTNSIQTYLAAAGAFTPRQQQALVRRLALNHLWKRLQPGDQCGWLRLSARARLIDYYSRASPRPVACTFEANIVHPKLRTTVEHL